MIKKKKKVFEALSLAGLKNYFNYIDYLPFLVKFILGFNLLIFTSFETLKPIDLDLMYLTVNLTV